MVCTRWRFWWRMVCTRLGAGLHQICAGLHQICPIWCMVCTRYYAAARRFPVHMTFPLSREVEQRHNGRLPVAPVNFDHAVRLQLPQCSGLGPTAEPTKLRQPLVGHLERGTLLLPKRGMRATPRRAPWAYRWPWLRVRPNRGAPGRRPSAAPCGDLSRHQFAARSA